MTDFELYTMCAAISAMSLIAAFMCGKARYYRDKCNNLEAEKERISILLGQKKMDYESVLYGMQHISQELIDERKKHSRSHQKRDERGRFVKQVEQA